MTETAIILAAGVGSRLRPLTENRPKCCVQVGGKSLIRRVIDQLQKADSNIRVYVMTGYLQEAVKSELSEYGSDVTILHNPDYASTNNMESCRMALETRQETGGSIILNADCVYEDSIIEKMVSSEGNVIATDSSAYFEENMKVKLVDGIVRDISKSLPNADDIVTSIDLYRFNSHEVSLLHDIMKGYKDRGDLNQWTEVAISDLVSDPQIEIRTLDNYGARWVEIDDHNDLKRATEIFK